VSNPVMPLNRGDRFSVAGEVWRVLGAANEVLDQAFIENRCHPHDVVARSETTREKRIFAHEFLTDGAVVDALTPQQAPAGTLGGSPHPPHAPKESGRSDGT
jgi:hypothetical protein